MLASRAVSKASWKQAGLEVSRLASYRTEIKQSWQEAELEGNRHGSK
jgi:hypothetical protein